MTDTAISIQADGSTLRIADPVTGEQYAIHADQPVTPTPSDDDLAVPVSQTVRLKAKRLTVDAAAWVRLREEDGTNIHTLRFNETISRQDGTWLLELAGPIKSYAKIHGPFRVTTTPDDVTIEWETSSEIVLAVRSLRRHPTDTITTTREPADIATAISQLSAGLETLSPERSFQTLRNHPPDIEIGDELRIPDSVTRHDSSITLSLPFQYEYLYAAAPVTFYLNATLTEGEPAIHIDSYGTWNLPRESFAEQCVELLKQCVFLDCLTRSDGLYPTTLEAETELKEKLNFDWTELYDVSLAERTAQYLNVEYDTISDLVPEWPARGYVPPTNNKNETGWRVEAETYPSLHFGVGSLITHKFTQDGTTSIVGKSIIRDDVSDAILRDYLSVEPSPVWYDGEWTWGDELIERLWETDEQA
ncbi:hypothetical protein [Halosegnis longus]|uniref:Uncharacterized protein n=1 Tax=Halosegnis longus TaxID=2216012 RepID=A0AAJ4UVT0_9EURY|nr:hypothetical protein Nmn1133_06380 [Salella cibi]